MPPRARKAPAKAADDGTTVPKTKKSKGAAVATTTDDDIPGNTFCITGKLARPRAEIEAEIQGLGGQCAKSVTAAVTILVSNESGTKKCQDAAARGVRVVDETWLQERIDNGGMAPGTAGKGKGKSKSKSKSTPAAAPAAKRSKKGGAAAAAAAAPFDVLTTASSEPLDPHVAQASTNQDAVSVAQNGHQLTLNADGETLDATLTCIEPSKNSDKFYLLQCLGGASKGDYYVYSRYGRTGTEGQKALKGPMSEEDAVAEFNKTFRDKTGRAWEARQQVPAKKKAGKYDYIEKDYNIVPGSWRYWVDDYVNGQATGWYDYVPEANANMEEIYSHLQKNLGKTALYSLGVRVVESGQYDYRVDLVGMTQANTTTGKQRYIRRTAPGAAHDDSPPGSASSSSSSAAMPSSPAPKATKASKASPKAKAASSSSSSTSSSSSSSSSSASSSAPAVGAVDSHANLPARSTIHGEYDAMLNQTNVSNNNNKFYKIQLVNTGTCYVVWTRWGRVGDVGQSAEKVRTTSDDEAIKVFKKTFASKHGYQWDARNDGNPPKSGKYCMVELEHDADAAAAAASTVNALSAGASGGGGGGAAAVTLPSALEPETKQLVEFMFDDDMFASSMANLNIDVKKLPLGALSQSQVAKGHQCLVELKKAIKSRSRAQIEAQTNAFYSLIPHNFGRQRPPLIDNATALKDKVDMLNVLADIEAAQMLVRDASADGGSSSSAQEPHPADLKYKSLNADLELVDAGEPDYAMVETYANNTMGRKVVLQNIWRVDRHNEDKRFKQHASISNRRLLWHGTNSAVVAAIMKSGLRIMPHSGGRVGAGIYLASEHGKSANYVGCAMMGGKVVGVMMLVEAAMGREHSITVDDWSIQAAPAGYDSVVARGRQEPNPKHDMSWTPPERGAKAVNVSVGSPVATKHANSNFHNSEYLLYKESQHRIRFLITFEFASQSGWH